ncbi:MAG: hypothetical protein A3F16_06295 [Deltaproteobacteria bacterium RIFCSPHIGHO2_12_FULL_43_9]|nr:MAG: hypothetical protein A3F16_06295 [Deltaproteobacteria bacterium RIFCSPHIGHO2_12_FULL_43_9]
MDCAPRIDISDLGSSFLQFSYNGKPFLFHYSTFELFEIDPIVTSLFNKVNNNPIEALNSQEKAALREIRSLTQIQKKDRSPTSPSLSAISLELNHTCNLRCKYCYVFANDNHILPESSPHQMRWEVAKSVVDFFLNQLTPGSSFFIRLFGGEPLLSFPLIKKIVSHVEEIATSKNITTEYLLITNGTVLTDEIVSFLESHNVNLAFSVDSTEIKHDKLRPTSTGAGSFKKIEENRKHIKKSNIKKQPIANVVVNRQNTDMFENYSFLINSGYKTVNFSFIFTNKKEFQLETADFPKLKKEYIKIRDYILEDLPNRLSTTPLISDIFQRLKNNIARKNFCGAGKSYIGVGMDGSFYPCHRFVGNTKFKLGDPVSGINDSARRLFLQPHIESRPVCAICPVRNVCGGGCGHTNLMYNGGIEEPRELFCLLKKFEVECALYLLLHEGEIYETCKKGEKTEKSRESKSKEGYKEAA